MPLSLNRRHLLLASGAAPAALLLAGCTDDAEPLPADPERDALEAAAEVERALQEAVTTWGQANPGPLAEEAIAVVDAHLTALDTALGTTAVTSPSATATGAAPSTIEVVRSADSAADAHTRSLRRSPVSTHPLLASLAASDAALGAALRRSVT